MEQTSVLGLVLRLVLSMGVVLVLMVLAARVLRTRAFGGTGRRPSTERVTVQVLGRQSLGRTAQVAVVRAGGRVLVVGVTESSVQLLAEADPEAIAREQEEQEGGHGTATPHAMTAAGRTGMALLDALRDRTVRRT